jgi:magnesium transporter
MLRVFAATATGLRAQELADGDPLPTDTVWLDLMQPSRVEELRVEKCLGLEVPTREEMQEIEVSSRLYQDDDTLYMTALVLAHADTPNPESTPITFILVGRQLVTLRYAEPRSFATFAFHAERQAAMCSNGAVALVSLLETIVDRTADILERVGGEVDNLLREVFERRPTNGHPSRLPASTVEDMFRLVGRDQFLTAKARESLVSLSRLLSFLELASEVHVSKELRSRVKTLHRDIHSLTDQTAFITNNITFLLDTLLGLLNIEQNQIIKIFSVAAVVFLPPTLVASIYGMNFEHIPELGWKLGYPLALLLMVGSAILPYLYFKRRGWL